MTPVIRIDDQVMDELKKRAVALGLVFEPPNATLRRVLGLDAAMRAIADEIVQDAITKHSPNKNVDAKPFSDLDRKALVDKIVQEALTKHGVNKNVVDAKALSGADMKAIAGKIVEDTLKQFAEDKNVIEIKLNPSSRKYVYIPLPKDKRHFFPGLEVDFELVTDVGVLTAHVTSAPNGTPRGDPHAGGHIRGRFGPWYAKHPELKAGDRLRIQALEPGKRYNLSVVSKGA